MSHPDIRPARILQPVPDDPAGPDEQARYAVTEALRLAAAGYQLCPVTITRRPDGKKGATFHRQWRHEDAWSSDPDQIRAWSIDYPDASYAIRTGPTAGIDVIDLDVKDDVDAVTWWAQQGHDLGSMIVETPSGGLHLYLPACDLPTSAGMFAPGVDTRGDGGLVFAPGAYVHGLDGHPEPGTYRIQGDLVCVGDLRPLDPHLVQTIRDADHRNATQYRADGAIILKDLDWAENACSAKLNELATLPPRTGGSHFRDVQMGAAMMLGRLVEAGAAERDKVIEVLEDATIKVWGSVSADDTRNILSGLADGPRKERWRWRPEEVPDAAEGDAETHTKKGTGALNLPPEFWQARASLKHIADAATAGRACPDAVLAAMLARQASHMGPDDTVDIGIAPAPLNLFAILYGRPAAGKGRAAKVAKHCLPRPEHLGGCDYDHHPRWRERPLGSGEGLVESYFGIVDEPQENDETKTRKVKRQVRKSIMFTVDEGEAFTRKASRNGTTIAQVIRSAWSGETLGEANASADRDRQLDEGSYAIGMTILFQPDTIGPLFDPAEVGGGTPHRFLYASAANYRLPKQRPAQLPADPGALRLPRRTLTPGEDGVLRAPQGSMRGARPLRFRLVDDAIREELLDASWAGLRGEETDELNGHRTQMHGRVAAVLAYWDGGREDITAEDWHLAGAVLDTSDRVRDYAIGYGTARRREEMQAADTAYVLREVRAREAVAESEEQRERARLVKTAAQISRRVGKVHREAGAWSAGSEVRSAAGDHKAQWRDAVEYAVDVEWLVADDGENRGRKKGTTVWGPGPKIHEVPGFEMGEQ